MWKAITVTILAALAITGCTNSTSIAQETGAVKTQAQAIVNGLVSTFAALTQTAIAAQPSNTATAEPTETPSPTADLLQIPDHFRTSCVPTGTQRELAQVVHVVDGDTIDVSINGQTYRVRYIGMDTPETGSQLFSAATSVNSRLVAGQQVLLVKDVSETDGFGRLLRYVFVGETFVNHELVVRGYAQILTDPPDVACSDTFLTAQQAARTSALGLWAVSANPTSANPAVILVVPPPVSTSAPPPQSNCSPAYPSVCIPPKPPDLDCSDITFRRFTVLAPDPHGFDGDKDGIGCES